METFLKAVFWELAKPAQGVSHITFTLAALLLHRSIKRQKL
jgi:hypothetical protein